MSAPIAVPKTLGEAIALLMRVVEHLGALEDEDDERQAQQNGVALDLADLEARVSDLEMEQDDDDD